MTAGADWLGTARRLAEQPDDAEALAWLASAPPPPERPPAPPPPDLSARPAPLPAVAWHAARLRALAAGDESLTRAYHARWLWHLLAPEDPAGWPLISVVIPVYNRHDLMLEAVASALDCGYPRLEICLCDDASASDPFPLLAHLGARLRYRRLTVNGGVAVARQTALELARGELVQFLDSDDLLQPGVLTAKLAALAAVPDAEVCICTLPRVAPDMTPEQQRALTVRHVGGPDCATRLPPLIMVQRLPFLPSAVLVARHRMLVHGFDRSLRFHEDRLAFAWLGLMGVKCIGLTGAHTIRRWLSGSVTRTLHDTLGQQSRVLLTLLQEALARPAFWPVCGRLLAQLFEASWGALAGDPYPANRALLAQVLRHLEQQVAAPPEGLSARPLIGDLAAALEGVMAREGESALGKATLARLRGLMEQTRPPGPADLALWRTAPDPAQAAGGLRPIFAALSRALRQGEAWVPLASLGERPFRSLPHPAKRRWKLLARLARRLGEGPARLAGRLLG